MKRLISFVCILAGIAFGIYLGGYVMLFGGILEILNNWSVDNGAVVCGILKAIFFEFGVVAGVIVGIILGAIMGTIGKGR